MVKVRVTDVKGAESLSLGPEHESDWGEEPSFRLRTNTECWDITAPTERLRMDSTPRLAPGMRETRLELGPSQGQRMEGPELEPGYEAHQTRGGHW